MRVERRLCAGGRVLSSGVIAGFVEIIWDRGICKSGREWSSRWLIDAG